MNSKGLPPNWKVKAEQAERSLSEYVKQAWHVIEPATVYVHGWHLDAISEHLESCTKAAKGEPGEIRNLIINVPPRHMKSLAVCVFWPTWVWASWPESRWLFSSYAETLAVRDSMKCRRLIQSPWYQERWGGKFQIGHGQNLKTRFENDKSGYRIAVGVGGGATGEGGNFVVVDDSLKALDADSDTTRETGNTWWDETMSTRLNDPKTGVLVVVAHRLHQDDLTGHLLEMARQGGNEYVHLCLPAEYEPRMYLGPLKWQDPRTEAGELLWPERFGSKEIIELKAALGGERAIAGQLQQRPSPAGGSIYKADWWENINRYDPTDKAIARRCVGRWISIDTALKDKASNDYSAFGVYELTPDYQLIKRHGERARLQFPDLIRRIERMSKRFNKDGKLKGIVIEDKVSGTSAFQTLRASSAEGLRDLLIAFQPQGSKEVRWKQASVWCERGMVKLPDPDDSVEWLFDFEAELFGLPATKFKDQADEFAQIVIYLEHYLAEGYQRIVKGLISGSN